MTHQRILHQTSCSYTPQHNNVAGRKNRHLIETVHTLFIESHVPLHFWGDALLAFCYLINKVPSSSIQNQVPHSSHSFALSLCVFGSTCFVHNLALGKDKLSQCSQMCLSWLLSSSKRVSLLFT